MPKECGVGRCTIPRRRPCRIRQTNLCTIPLAIPRMNQNNHSVIQHLDQEEIPAPKIRKSTRLTSRGPQIAN
jgi:hypothetical protein